MSRSKKRKPKLPKSARETWQGLQSRFEQLAHEEEATPDRWLSAYCDYRDHPIMGFSFCLLHKPPYGLWRYGDGLTEDFQNRFRNLARSASIALGYPTGPDLEDYANLPRLESFWLHRLYSHSHSLVSYSKFSMGSKESGAIPRVCEASAIFCSWLKSQAPEERRDERQAKRAEKDKREMERLLERPVPKSVRDLLLRLTPVQKRVATLSWGYTWSVARIARAMSKDRKTISETLERAKSNTQPRIKKPKSDTVIAADEARNELEDELIRKIDSDLERQRKKPTGGD